MQSYKGCIGGMLLARLRKNFSFVSETSMAAKISTKPMASIVVIFSLVKTTPKSTQKSDSVAKIIAALLASVNFCPKFCNNSASAVATMAR